MNKSEFAESRARIALIKNATSDTESFDMSLGETVRVLRKLAGLSQAELAERSNRPRNIVSLIERNRIEPTLWTMTTLFSALGFDVEIRLNRKTNDDV